MVLCIMIGARLFLHSGARFQFVQVLPLFQRNGNRLTESHVSWQWQQFHPPAHGDINIEIHAAKIDLQHVPDVKIVFHNQ